MVGFPPLKALWRPSGISSTFLGLFVAVSASLKLLPSLLLLLLLAAVLLTAMVRELSRQTLSKPHGASSPPPLPPTSCEFGSLLLSSSRVLLSWPVSLTAGVLVGDSMMALSWLETDRRAGSRASTGHAERGRERRGYRRVSAVWRSSAVGLP